MQMATLEIEQYISRICDIYLNLYKNFPIFVWIPTRCGAKKMAIQRNA